MKDEIIAAVAQGWCTKENENKPMDSTLAMAIVDNVIVVIEKLEARIEELISSKGIKELEARLANAEAHGQDFKDECGRLTATLKLSQLRADDKEVEQSVNDALQTTKIAKLEARLADAEVVSKIPTHNHTHKISG